MTPALALALLAAGAPGPAALPEERAGGKPFIYIGINSGANSLKYDARRNRIRATCMQEYTRDARVSAHFFVGEPDEYEKTDLMNKQGRQATPREQGAAERILREEEQHHDLVVVPARDEYRDKTGKVLDILRRGYDSGAQYVVKLDDDMCLNLTFALPLLEQRSARTMDQLYLGRYEFTGTEFKVMQGPHNYTVPFMGGASYLVSRELAHLITDPEYDLDHSGLYELYGTSSEDANVGRFVAYAAKRHGVHVDYETERRISYPVDATDDGSETFPNSQETKATKSRAGLPETAPGWTESVTPFWEKQVARVDAGQLRRDHQLHPLPPHVNPSQPPATFAPKPPAQFKLPPGDPLQAKLMGVQGILARIRAARQAHEAEGKAGRANPASATQVAGRAGQAASAGVLRTAVAAPAAGRTERKTPGHEPKAKSEHRADVAETNGLRTADGPALATPVSKSLERWMNVMRTK